MYENAQMLCYLAIISDELNSMARIYPGGAEITSFYTHFARESHVLVLVA